MQALYLKPTKFFILLKFKVLSTASASFLGVNRKKYEFVLKQTATQVPNLCDEIFDVSTNFCSTALMNMPRACCACLIGIRKSS